MHNQVIETTVPRSAVPECFWPAQPDDSAAQLLALLCQLEDSQWYSADELLLQQMKQLAVLLPYALHQVPYYRQALKGFSATRLSPDVWCSLPILTREQLHDNYQALQSSAIPKSHGQTKEISTSGSTGKPVRVLQTRVSDLIAGALTLREHQWHQRDPRGKLAAIHLMAKERTGYPGHRQDAWGWPTSSVYPTGPAALLSVQTPVARQLDWLREFNPEYLLTLASNLDQLLEESARRKKTPGSLRSVTVLGEVLTGEVRDRCGSLWQVPVVNNYSTREAGTIAMQCPEHNHLHVCAEATYVEVLRDDGTPCAPGEIGRVVVTPLHNFAMPLLRYELGDYAEAGTACACGRGLPVLRRIVGRQYNLLRLADGSRVWPSFGRTRMVGLAPIRQHQFIQTGPETIAAKLVVERPLTSAEEQSLLALWRERLPEGFRVELDYVAEIPRGAGGKYEYFRCDWRPL